MTAQRRIVELPGGTYRKESDTHYIEEAPTRMVEVTPFAINVHPVTNRQFAAFVADSCYVTFAERTPEKALYPGADQAMLVPGAMVFRPPTRKGAASHWSS